MTYAKPKLTRKLNLSTKKFVLFLLYWLLQFGHLFYTKSVTLC